MPWCGSCPTARDGCEKNTLVEPTGHFYCADVFGRLVEHDVADGRMIRRLDAQNGAVGSLWPAGGGTELVSFGNNETSVTRWRLDGTGPITRRLPPGHSPFGYSPDGTRLTSLAPPADPNSLDPAVADAVVLDPATGDVIDELGALTHPVWHGDDTLGGVIPGADGMTFAVYELSTSSIVTEGAILPYDRFGGALDVGAPRAWVYYPRMTSAGERETIWTIDTKTGQRIEPTIETTFVVGSAATRDGKLLAVGQNDIAIFDTETGEEVGRIEGHLLRGVHITASGVLIAWSLGGEATMYDLTTLEPLRTLPGNRGYLQIVESDTTGTILASLGGDRTVAIHDVATAVTVGDAITIPDDEVNAIALRPDGRELAIGGSAATSAFKSGTSTPPTGSTPSAPSPAATSRKRNGRPTSAPSSTTDPPASNSLMEAESGATTRRRRPQRPRPQRQHPLVSDAAITGW